MAKFQIVLEGPGGVLDVKYAATEGEIKAAVLALVSETASFDLGDRIVIEEDSGEA